jgi:hypothetical protein
MESQAKRKRAKTKQRMTKVTAVRRKPIGHIVPPHASPTSNSGE